MGLLCKSGIASMGELLDLDGVWDEQLMGTMLPVALELQADDAQMQFGAISAAVSQLSGGKAAREFRNGLARVREQARKAMRAARGLDNQDERVTSAADSMLELAKKIGVKFPSQRSKSVSSPTKMHGGPK